MPALGDGRPASVAWAKGLETRGMTVVQPQTVDIHEVVETQEKGLFPFSIFLMCCLVMLVDGFNQQSLNYAAPAIIEALGISPALMTGLVADINIFGWMLGAVGFP